MKGQLTHVFRGLANPSEAQVALQNPRKDRRRTTQCVPVFGLPAACWSGQPLGVTLKSEIATMDAASYR
jgi:hypothetical protein